MDLAIRDLMWFQHELKQNPGAYENQKMISMTGKKFIEVISKARARAGRDAKQQLVENRKRLAALESEISPIKAQHLAILEQRLANLKH